MGTGELMASTAFTRGSEGELARQHLSGEGQHGLAPKSCPATPIRVRSQRSPGAEPSRWIGSSWSMTKMMSIGRLRMFSGE